MHRFKFLCFSLVIGVFFTMHSVGLGDVIEDYCNGSSSMRACSGNWGRLECVVKENITIDKEQLKEQLKKYLSSRCPYNIEYVSFIDTKTKTYILQANEQNTSNINDLLKYKFSVNTADLQVGLFTAKINTSEFSSNAVGEFNFSIPRAKIHKDTTITFSMDGCDPYTQRLSTLQLENGGTVVYIGCYKNNKKTSDNIQQNESENLSTTPAGMVTGPDEGDSNVEKSKEPKQQNTKKDTKNYKQDHWHPDCQKNLENEEVLTNMCSYLKEHLSDNNRKGDIEKLRITCNSDTCSIRNNKNGNEIIIIDVTIDGIEHEEIGCDDILHARGMYMNNKCTIVNCDDTYDEKDGKCVKADKETSLEKQSAENAENNTTEPAQNKGNEEPNTGNPNNDSTPVENIDILGTVIDGDNGDALIGAHVVIAGTLNGTKTDENGDFSLENVPSNANIQFSFTGYKTETIKADNASGNIVLTQETNEIDGTTVVACRPINNADSDTLIRVNDGCKPTKCNDGYVLQNPTTKYLDQNGQDCQSDAEGCQSVTYGDACVQKTDDTKQEKVVVDESSAEPQMSKEEREKLIAEKEQALKAAKAKETSTANKALGAASMAASGIGAMELASAMAEKRADENAEADMTAYLATFRCDYGDGKSFKGGETEIQLPGGNALIGIYTEYMQLAADLKTRKQALGIKPGIESEVVLDASQTGLYDDVSVAPAEGAFTSIYRALTNPDGADAEKLDEQKSDTKTKRNIGIGLTATGVIGGAVGDMIINRDKSNTDGKSDGNSGNGLNSVLSKSGVLRDISKNK